MKNLLPLLFFAFAAATISAQTSVSILSQTPTETILQVSFPDADLQKVETPQGTAFVVGTDQCTPLLEAGAPDVPKLALSLQIPLTGKMGVEILEKSFSSQTNVLIAPSKGDLKRNINPADVPYTYGPAYSRDGNYPADIAALQSPFIFRDARGQTLWVSPVQYNPATKTMVQYRTLKIRVYKSGDTGENEVTHPSGRGASRTFNTVYKKFFINYNKALLSSSSVTNPELMLVIVKDELQETLQPLVEWKMQMGIQTTVVPLSETGATTPADLYNFVKNYYTAHGITYLLLVGDENMITPMVRPGSIYSCDNCLGYMDGNDHFPEVLVGRFHASNTEQLQVMINRNLDYEKTPLADPLNNWCATGMASASNQGQGIGDDNQADYEQGNEWKAKHLQDGFEKYWEFYDGDQSAISPTPGDVTADQPGDPINTQLVQLMNGRGVSLYNYTGHGWEQGLVSGNFNTDAVATLRNKHRYPIILAVACCAGNFTNGECLGEALQRAGNTTTGEAWGSIAAYLSSDFQSWAPPMEGQDGMNQYLSDADGVVLPPVISGMATYGNALMIAAYGQGGIDMADVWNPFCEPTLVPRTQLPQQLVVAHDTNIPIGSTSLTVNCPVEGALVSLYSEGQTLAVAIVENGTATFQFPSLQNPGDMVLTGTQFNYIPYQGTISVIVTSGPFLVQQSVVAHETLGNNNGISDYGETIALDLTLSNVGTAPAAGAVCHLSTNDPYIDLLNDTATFGTIEDSTLATVASAFTFVVHNDVPNGHIASFLAEITYNNGQTGTFTYSEKLFAPKMKVVDYTITEGAGSDNDGYFESGETLTLTIHNKNTGGSASGMASGTLTSTSGWITISPQVAIGTMAPDAGADAVFTISIAADVPLSTSVDLSYLLEAGAYFDVFTPKTIIINPIVENFESHNFNSYPWVMSGNKPWTTSLTAPFSGTSCSKSGLITHNQTSVMSLTLNVLHDDQISFARKTKSEAGFDFLRFYVDGIMQGEWSGNLPWEIVSFPVTAGMHTFKWTYEKDAIGSTYPDQVYVDEIILPLHEVVVGTNSPFAVDFESAVTPNPAHDHFSLQLRLPQEMDLQYSVTDATGRELTSGNMHYGTGSHRVNISAATMPAGIYYVKVGDAHGVITHKVVVE